VADTPVRLGCSLSPSRQLSPDALVELVLLAEKLGYESVWIPETWGWDAVSLLAVLAARTSRIRLASGVFNVFSRSAALIAQTAATLQGLSGGRFILGLGTSGPGVVEPWHGIPYRRPLGRTRDYVKIIRLALSGETVDFESDGIALHGFRLLNPPAAPVPIYLAALGPRNVRLTGELADGWLPIFAPRGHLEGLMTEFQQAVESAGRNVANIDVAAYLPAAIGPSTERLLAQQIAYYVGGMGTYYFEYVSRVGFGAPAQRIREAWEAGDRRRAVYEVNEDLLAACTLGPEATAARERVVEYRAEGIRLPVVTPPHGSTAQQVADTLEALQPATIMPA
jgi:F420-dependent oxidoreductase-like protein